MRAIEEHRYDRDLGCCRCGGEWVWFEPENVEGCEAAGPPPYSIKEDSRFEAEEKRDQERADDRLTEEVRVPREGDRVRLRADVERYPHFIAQAGATGTVTVADSDSVCVRMDETIEGCEEWDNEVVWYREDFHVVLDEIEILDESLAEEHRRRVHPDGSECPDGCDHQPIEKGD